METRPKIKLVLSPLDNKLERTGKIFLLVMWGFTLYALFKMPTTIPIHFNSSGEVDGYGNKIKLLFLPIVGTLIYFGLTKLNKYPHIFNYMTRITEENASQQYTRATRILRLLKLSVLLIFSLIILLIYFTTRGWTGGMAYWISPLTLAVSLGIAVVSVGPSLRKHR